MMKLLNFLKIFKQKKPTPLILNLTQLPEHFKKIENPELNKDITTEIIEILIKLTTTLEEKTETLKHIDLEEKKVEQRIKFIVKQNLDHYILNLEILIKNLNNIKTKNPEQLIKDLNTTLNNFDKKSKTNFEKATFLIGKELEEVNQTISNFFKELKISLNKNKKFLETNKIIENTKTNLNNLTTIKETKEEIKLDLGNHNQKLIEITEEITQTHTKIQKIKNSEEFQKELHQKNKLSNLNQTLNQTFIDFKKLINFKDLINLCHQNKKEMELIKQYQSNFQEILEQPHPEQPTIPQLTALLDSTNQNTKEVQDKIKQITTIKEQISKQSQTTSTTQQDLIKQLENKITDLKKESINKEYDITKEQTKLEKQKENKQKTLNKIKEELKKININLIDETKREDIFKEDVLEKEKDNEFDEDK